MDHPEKPLTAWQKVKLIVKVAEVRLRFVAVLVAVAVVIGNWDTILNYWDKWMRPSASTALELPPDQEFYCPMHPKVVRSALDPNGEKPKCPICGMPLSLRKKGEVAPLPDGITGRVQVSPERIRLAGIQTVPVRYQPLTRRISTVGNVVYDESRLARIVSRVGGYVEKLLVDTTYTLVRQGDPLAEVYSPELFSAAQELVTATKRGQASEMVDSIRRRLELLGVDRAEIDQIARSGAATPRLVIRSPQNGYVIGKPVVAGARVEPGMTLFEVADLSVVWIEADVYERDIAFLRVGQEVQATVDAAIDRTFTGKVSLVWPRMETATRTVRVRFEVRNPGNMEATAQGMQPLRPGMYATVRIDTPLDQVEPFRGLLAKAAAEKKTTPEPGKVLAVPERAVVDTGAKQIVYVQREPGLFEGVEVKLGPPTDGVYPVIRGLEPGQLVAAAGAFLIDAETRLNPAAASAYFGASGGPQSGPRGGTAPAGKKEPAAPKPEPIQIRHPTPEQVEKLARLSPADRDLAQSQVICPITGLALGSMGTPVKVTLKEQPVLLCCQGCAAQARNNADATLKRVAEIRAAVTLETVARERKSSHD